MYFMRAGERSGIPTITACPSSAETVGRRAAKNISVLCYAIMHAGRGTANSPKE